MSETRRAPVDWLALDVGGLSVLQWLMTSAVPVAIVGIITFVAIRSKTPEDV